MVLSALALMEKAEPPGLAGCNRLAQQERWKRCSGRRLFGSWSLLRDGWSGGEGGGLGSDGRLKGQRVGAAATACNGLAVVAATDANGAAGRERGCWGSDRRGAAPPLAGRGVAPAGHFLPCPPLTAPQMVRGPGVDLAARMARDRDRDRDRGTAAPRYRGSPRRWPPATGRAPVFPVGRAAVPPGPGRARRRCPRGRAVEPSGAHRLDGPQP